MAYTISIHTAIDLRKQFIDYNRNLYSYEAYEYFLELTEDNDQPLDVIALCCEWDELDYAEIAIDYDIDLSAADGDPGDGCMLVLDYLNDHTIAISTSVRMILYRTF
jgi:hypothetical protein